MAEKKLLLLTSEHLEPRDPSRERTANLEKAYAALAPAFELRWLRLPGKIPKFRFDAEPIRQLDAAVSEFLPDEIILLDSAVYPPDLLKPLFLRREETTGTADPLQEPPDHWRFPDHSFSLAIHVDGRFISNAAGWLRARNLLIQSPLRLLCASARHKALIEGLLLHPEMGNALVASLPVDCDFWRFDAETRQATRAQLGLGGSERMLLYSGPISSSRNTFRLLEEFSELVKQGYGEISLWLAGSFDDEDGPIRRMHTPQGYMFHRFQKAMAAFPGEVRSRIRFAGPQTAPDLRALHCAADAYVHLSHSPDEDIDLALAHALATGLPTILTDWGGNSELAIPRTLSARIPVELEADGAFLASERIQSALRWAAGLSLGEPSRTAAAKAFAARHSISAVSTILADLHLSRVPPFAGFSGKLALLAQTSDSVAIQRELLPRSGGVFEEIYAPYFGKAVN